MYVGNSTLNGVTISSGSTATVAEQHDRHARRDSITNNGTLAMNSAGSYTDFNISGTVTTDRRRHVWRCRTVATTRIYGTATRLTTLTNDAGNTIQGCRPIGDGYASRLNNSGNDQRQSDPRP